jgi:hypothetical protein
MRLAPLCLLVFVSGCSHPQHRFVPMGDSTVFALDTTTGKRCLTVPASEVSGRKSEDNGPYCEDLYKNSK